MEAKELAVTGVWEFVPRVHRDHRGTFCELFTSEALVQHAGRGLELAQLNVSTSHRNVVRGIHYTSGTLGQAKLVTCLQGTVLDVVVDLRRDADTFGRFSAVYLDETRRNSVFISEGIGHAFQVLSSSATLLYATSAPYDPDLDQVLNPLDPDLELPWVGNSRILLSDRDRSAPSFAQYAHRRD